MGLFKKGFNFDEFEFNMDDSYSPNEPINESFLFSVSTFDTEKKLNLGDKIHFEMKKKKLFLGLNKEKKKEILEIKKLKDYELGIFGIGFGIKIVKK
jgi:hypothetical protein